VLEDDMVTKVRERPRRLTRGQRIEQLLDVAESLFAAQGYDATSIEQLAHAAGISRPIVYEHFGSKEGIYLACLRRARTGLDSAIAEAVVGVDDLEQRLHAGIDACFTFIETQPERWAVLFNGVAVTGTVATEATKLRFDTIGAIADLLRAAGTHAPDMEIEAFAHALSGAAEQIERWWRANPQLRRKDVVDYLHRFAWSGLHQLAPQGSEAGGAR
jgi:AcrR family transcriptional regulator